MVSRIAELPNEVAHQFSKGDDVKNGLGRAGRYILACMSHVFRVKRWDIRVDDRWLVSKNDQAGMYQL